jgi:hypothetical protein
VIVSLLFFAERFQRFSGHLNRRLLLLMMVMMQAGLVSHRLVFFWHKKNLDQNSSNMLVRFQQPAKNLTLWVKK